MTRQNPHSLFTIVFSPMSHDFPSFGSVLKEGPGPVIGGAAVLLILGSFPGRISLSQSRYYANPQNQFWHSIEALTGIDRHLPYDHRLEKLVKIRIALWDVISTCRRRECRSLHQKSFLQFCAGASQFPSRHQCCHIQRDNCVALRIRPPAPGPHHAGHTAVDKPRKHPVHAC